MREQPTDEPKATYDQPGQTVYGPQTNIGGGVETGGGLFNAGTLNQYHFAGAGIGPGAAVDLATALGRLGEMPSEDLPAEVGPPPGSWMPLAANPLFVGRAAELRAVAAGLRARGGAVVVTGLGGVGKSQLASSFVQRYGQYFLGGVFWLSFADPTAIEAEVAQCAAWLGDLAAGVTHLPLPDQVQLVRRAWQSPWPRLLVFDNCEDPALVTAWRPSGGGCRVLVTSRRGRWHRSQGVTLVGLGSLRRLESVALLTKLAPVAVQEARDEAVLAEIAGELGDLPLALHMAGSYLAEAAYDLSPAAYLAELRRPGLLAHGSLQGGDYSPTGHELHVARTFALSLGRLQGGDENEARARQVLACMAGFAPGEALPRSLLRSAAGLGEEEAAGEPGAIGGGGGGSAASAPPAAPLCGQRPGGRGGGSYCRGGNQRASCGDPAEQGRRPAPAAGLAGAFVACQRGRSAPAGRNGGGAVQHPGLSSPDDGRLCGGTGLLRASVGHPAGGAGRAASRHCPKPQQPGRPGLL